MARTVTGLQSPVVGGALIAALVLSSAAAILVVRERAPRQALFMGAVALAGGVVVTLFGMHGHSALALFLGTVIAGFGFGSSFNGAMRSLVPLAEAHERAGLMSSFFVLSYLAFSLPAILAGLFAGVFGLQATAMGYGITLVVMALVALRLMARSAATATGRANS